MLSLNSTDNLLNSFPMFGHPGISALEYAGQAEKRKTLSAEVSLKRKSTTSTDQEQTAIAETEPECEELSPPVHFIDEFGNHQRRRGTFINHTPRNFEMRASKIVDVHQSSRAGSENYSRPLSRQSSMASGSPVPTGQPSHSPSTSSGTFGKRSTLSHDDVAEMDSTEAGSPLSPEVYQPSMRSHRRSLSAPPRKILTYQSGATTLVGQPSRDPSVRSTSLPNHQALDMKQRRRQTPYKLAISKGTHNSRHAPLEPWVAEHRRKEIVETIGDVPVDMAREVSAEIGTFGVIQRYFDSQGGGPVSSPRIIPESLPPKTPAPPLPVSPEPGMRRLFMGPTAIYPIDELALPKDPPPVPSRSPKRLTNPIFPITTESAKVRYSDFNFAAEGEYSPYDAESDILHVSKKRTQERLRAGQAAWVGSPNVGKLAPPILGHDALTASSDLGLNDLSYYLKHTGPSPEPLPMTTQQNKKGIKLFKAHKRKTLAARVGSVEGSPQRVRSRPAVPSCAKEMTTSGGAKHLKIIIPTETPSGTQAMALSMSKPRQSRSRHISITFTEEMLNPLASPAVERMMSKFDMPERPASAPAPQSPRSPKRSPMTPKPVLVNDHPLASRDEQTRARKLRDLQRVKRKPVPDRTLPEQCQDIAAGALPTPAHTPEPVINNASEDEGTPEEENPTNKIGQLQDRVVSLQRQNTQLAEALAKIVGLELEDGDLKSEEVLRVFRQIRASKVVSVS
jgi:hypothetical protein